MAFVKPSGLSFFCPLCTSICTLCKCVREEDIYSFIDILASRVLLYKCTGQHPERVLSQPQAAFVTMRSSEWVTHIPQLSYSIVGFVFITYLGAFI